MAPSPEIHGDVADGFEPARAAFAENFAKRGEIGASFCAFRQGERVVDLWAGKADKASGREWRDDTLAILFSSTKGLAATCCLMLADRGLLDYESPVARYWPEFGQAGKAAITVRQLMNHRAGLCAIDRPLSLSDLADPSVVSAALETQEPLWEPGTAQGYHGVTFGLYVGELFRRITGSSIGTFLRDEVAGPLGADIHLGLPEREDPRVATLYTVGATERIFRAIPYVLFNPGVVERRLVGALMKKDSDTARAFRNPAELGTKGVNNFNLPAVRRLELPWANAFGTARGLATMYSALACGGAMGDVRLVSSEAIDAVRPRQTFGQDRVLHKPLGWSQGFIKEETHLFSPNEHSFGHPGAGGAIGFCDPDRGLAWAYVMNRMDFRLRSPRAIALSHALYRCIGS